MQTQGSARSLISAPLVESVPGLDGLLHVSEIAHYRVKDVREDEMKEGGDQVMVKVINMNTIR